MPDRIGGYEVEGLIGAGSFATVWLARDPTLDARVAIKVLADNWSHDLRVRERFLDEGRLLWRLDDDRLVRVHGVGETDDGRPYLVMSYADRGSLRERLTAGTVGDASERLALLARVADCVAVLHRHDIVHRDLTPANILFRARTDGSEQVLVGDLGLAKALAVSSGLTGRAGTPGYMAPEQDRDVAQVDARSDVYALGVLGDDLLAGVGVSDDVRALLADARAADPVRRPIDATAFAERLGRAIGAPGLPSPSPLKPPARRKRRATRVAIVAVAAVAVAVPLVIWAIRSFDGTGGVTWDASHRIGLTLPAGWRASGTGWQGRQGSDGRAEPAFVASPEPSRWPGDPSVPGAFVGLSPSAGSGAAAVEALLASRAHDGCTREPTRQEAHGGRSWTIVVYGSCSDGREIVEAGASDPAGVIYVEQTAPGVVTPAAVGIVLGAVVVG